MTEDDGPLSVAIGEDEDDSTIADDDYLYRRVPRDPVNTKQEADAVRASSAAFQDNSDGISVFLESVMAELNLEIPWSVIAGKEPRRFAIARLRVEVVRGLGCGVTRDADPAEEPPHPCNPAHALVHLPPVGKRPQHRLRGELARLAELLQTS